MIFPGDLEEPGWRILLELDNFRWLLADVNVFVAPHHGRRNGYYGEVFRYCRPDIVVFSDQRVQHTTQETSGLYGRQAIGVAFDDGKARSVVTTRKNGKITFQSTRSWFNVHLSKA